MVKQKTPQEESDIAINNAMREKGDAIYNLRVLLEKEDWTSIRKVINEVIELDLEIRKMKFIQGLHEEESTILKKTKMELKKLKDIRIELHCDRKTCRGCENLKKCDFCSANFCLNYQDERGEWGVIDDNDLCPVCFAVEKFRKKKGVRNSSQP